MTQIRSSNTWESIWDKLCYSLFSWYWHCCTLIRECLTCSTGQKIFGWSQCFRLCDQEELPCCDTCGIVPYQSHIRYSECGSTSAVAATHYCEVQMCLSMNYVFIQHYLRLLAPCCNLTCHLKQMPYRDEYNLQVLKSPRMSVTSTMEVLWSKKKNIHGKLGKLISHCVECILSI